MAELIDLPPVNPAVISDDDYVLVWRTNDGTQQSKKIKRRNFLAGIAYQNGDHNFGTVEIDSLQATVTGLTFPSGTVLSDTIAASATVAHSDILAGEAETVVVAVEGATTGGFLNWAMTTELPDGLTFQAWISGADEVSFKFYNATGSTISGTSYTARITILANT